ncbi:MAG: DUF6036 family nucleotidyltransferase [Candidatus Sumerlaeota bacterium]
MAELGRRRIDFILVGGLAVDLCGFARSTIDMDIVISSDPENIRSLIGALEYFGEGSGAQLTENDFPLKEGCIRVNEAFPLDIFTMMSGKTWEDLLPYTSITTIENIPIRHLSPEGIIMLKAGSTRPKDQLDIQAMQKIIDNSSH